MTGQTPLHIAASEGHLKVVQYLLGHGATVHAKDRYSDTPLSKAVKFSLAANADLVGLEIWELAGARMDVTGYDGKTPLEVAQAAGKQTHLHRGQAQAAGKKEAI